MLDSKSPQISLIDALSDDILLSAIEDRELTFESRAILASALTAAKSSQSALIEALSDDILLSAIDDRELTIESRAILASALTAADGAIATGAVPARVNTERLSLGSKLISVLSRNRIAALFQPRARMAAVAVTVLCIVLIPLVLLHQSPNDLFAASPDAVTQVFAGYYGDFNPKETDPKKRTEVMREHVTLTVSPTSDFIRGQVVDDANRFVIAGFRARDTIRDDMVLNFVSERGSKAASQSAPTIGTYILRKLDAASYTGLSVYWDRCAAQWVQCPYALERGGEDTGEVDNYARTRWPARFNPDDNDNQCHVMKLTPDIDIAIAAAEEAQMKRLVPCTNAG